jgi:predicted 2-oxoglutarate/Fe(II)-dependent dioxygenase YbiX
LYQGEDHVLFIDSHTQFARGWDDLLIGQLKACPGDKPMLSGVPHPYSQAGGALEQRRLGFRYPSRFSTDGVLKLGTERFSSNPPEAVRAPFLDTRFIFARASFLEEVPPDPEVYFTEEEITLSLRAWTHGWDVYCPPEICVWHLYNSDGQRRPLHWREHDNWRSYHRRSMQVYRATVSGDLADFRDARGRYAPGGERTIGQFNRFAGIDLAGCAIERDPGLDSFAERIRPWCSDVGGLWVRRAEVAAGQNVALTGQPSAPTVRRRGSHRASGRLYPSLGRDRASEPPAALEVGDQVPYFTLPDVAGAHCHVEIYAGRHLFLHVVLDPGSPVVQALSGSRSEADTLAGQRPFQRLGLFSGSLEEFRASNCSEAEIRWCLDPSQRLLSVLQVERHAAKGAGLVTYLLDPNLRILGVCVSDDWHEHLRHPAGRIPAHETPVEQLAFHPPVMVIPAVLNGQLIERLTDYWANGRQFSGGVGAGDGSHVDYDVKRRTDVSVTDRALQREVDQAFARNLFPELRKVTGYDLRYRERYKVGCYAADDAGLFGQHRDTGHLELAFRRYAVSLLLNDDYQGGELVFPEYGAYGYRVGPGSAVVFPTPLMHEVLPVTEGRRLVLITFLFDEEQAAFRSCLRQYRGLKDDTPDYRTTVKNHYPGLLTRSIYTRRLAQSSVDRDIFGRYVQEPPPELLALPRRLPGPPGVLIIENYLAPEQCQAWRNYADGKLGSRLGVVDFQKSNARRTATMDSPGRVTEKVPLDDIFPEVRSAFLQLYQSVLAEHYRVEFEWFERPQMLRYSPGGVYKRHADGDHWLKDEKKWVRSHDRDYSVLLYLNDDFEGGSLHFPRLDFRFKPRTGMLVAFPSNYRYEHAAEETTSGQRYALVSWAAILGSQRVKEKPPWGSVMLNGCSES